jgi:Domain of unknown function (DUF4365)
MPESTPITESPEIREQLSRIVASECFRRRLKLLDLFEYLVKETIAGRAAQITQKRIAAEVFGIKRSKLSQSNVSVRISASRLRDSLDEYYRKEAQPDEIRIYMPPRYYFIAVERVKDPNYSGLTSQTDGFEQNFVSPKRISENDIIGELGVAFINKLFLEMGFLWFPTRLEAGIDGYVEVRLDSGAVTNCIIQVQSKATDRPFEAETSSGFEFRCASRDLDYWLAGNAPVILVRSRPRTNEAYWVSLKDYFSDPAKRKSGRIVFDKLKDRLDDSAKPALQRIAIPATSGLYLGTEPKPEIIHSNLLRLASFPTCYYVAATEYRTPGEIFATLRELVRNPFGEWVLHSKMLTSFHDLSVSPWTKVCDRGSVEELNTNEWAQSDDPTRRKQFVQLLNACLRATLYRKGVKFSRDNQCYYFRATQDLSEREYSYQSREHKASRSVFKGYPKRSDHTQMSFYRHSAFSARFVRYDSTWYLQISPTYHFTRDGERISLFGPNLLSGMKRLETNQAVHGQVVMWGHLLTERSLFESGPRFLDFSSLLQFELGVGLDDDAWLKREDTDKAAALEAPPIDARQESLIL